MIVQGEGDEIVHEECVDPACEDAEPGTQHLHLVKVDWFAKFTQTTELEDLWRRRIDALPDKQVEGELTEDAQTPNLRFPVYPQRRPWEG